MNNWPTESLGELLQFITTGSRGWASYYRDSGDLFLRIQNVGRNQLLLDDIAYVAAPDTAEAKRTLVQPGDVLLSMTADLGRTAVIPKNLGTAYINQHLAILRVREIDPRFLSAFLASPEGQRQIQARNRHGVKAGLNFDDVRSFTIPLPSLAEQQRIAEVLDRPEALRAKRSAALALLDTLAQAIFLELFGDPVQSPKYPHGTIRPFAQASSGKSAKGVMSTTVTDIPIYGGNGVNGWATKPLYEKPVLVFGRVGQHCGNTEITDGPAWITDNAIVVTFTDRSRLAMKYLVQAFRMTKFSERVKHLDLPFINQSTILDYPLCLPPIEVQQEFARRIDSVEQLKAKHRLYLGKLDELFASLQHRAFRGEL